MADPIFGISIRKVDEEGRPVMAADLSTIGLIGPAPDADEDAFPLNTPVQFDSNKVSLLTDIGEDGYLADAIRGINDQLDEFQFAARIVVVRTEEGSGGNVPETIANIVGDSLLQTGLWAFLKSAPELGFTPRLIIAPGYTGQMCNTVDTVEQDSGGGGTLYEDGVRYELTFSGGGSAPFQATAHAFGQADGTLGPAIIDTYGGYYDSAPTVTADPPQSGGDTALYTATINAGANPVCASLTPVCNQLLGHAIVESSGISRTDDIDWRETLQSQRLIPISGGCKILDTDTGTTLVRPLAPRIAGIAVRRDHEKGAPFHSWANQAIQGIISPARGIGFYLTDDASEGQELLRNNIGIVARGEAGSEFAIASGGFVFIGTDTASEDTLWKFYNVSRGRDYIHLGLLRALRFYLGRYNIVGHTVRAILNTMEYFLADLQAKDHILGYKVNFAQTGNTAEEIRLGHLTVGFNAEEPPVLTRLTIESSRYRLAIDAMVSDLASQLNLAA